MIITSQYPCPHVPDVSVPEYVLRHAPRLHDRPALVDGTDGRTVTYGELAATVRRVATGEHVGPRASRIAERDAQRRARRPTCRSRTADTGARGPMSSPWSPG